MKPAGILWASFFINAVSFLFTVRLRLALLLIGVFFGIGVIGNWLLNIEFFSQPVEFCLVIAFLFAPVILNAIFITIHESHLRLSHGGNAGKIYELVDGLLDLGSRLR